MGGNAGYIYNYGSKNLRINDRFFKGGNTFRGFDRAGVGPKEIITDRPRVLAFTFSNNYYRFDGKTPSSYMLSVFKSK